MAPHKQASELLTEKSRPGKWDGPPESKRECETLTSFQFGKGKKKICGERIFHIISSDGLC